MSIYPRVPLYSGVISKLMLGFPVVEKLVKKEVKKFKKLAANFLHILARRGHGKVKALSI